MEILRLRVATLSSLRACRMLKTVVKWTFWTSPSDPFVTSCVADVENWCFFGGGGVVVFLWWCCGGVFVVVLWLCFCGGVVVVFWCICCAVGGGGGVFVVVFSNIAQSSTEVMVFLWLCFCGDVVVVLLCGGVVVSLWWVWWCF